MPYASREQIAHLLKLTPRMVNRHVKENGMPIVSRGEYDLVASVHWYIDYLKEELRRARRGDESEQQARARLIKATANLRELDYRRELGDLIHVDTVGQLWERIVIAFRSRVLAIPAKLPQRLIGCRNLSEIKELLESEIHEALGELSTKEIDLSAVKEPQDTYTANDPPRRSAPKTHRERVGRPVQVSEPGGKRGARKVANRKG